MTRLSSRDSQKTCDWRFTVAAFDELQNYWAGKIAVALRSPIYISPPREIDDFAFMGVKLGQHGKKRTYA